jgi:hypothetical protein
MIGLHLPPMLTFWANSPFQSWKKTRLKIFSKVENHLFHYSSAVFDELKGKFPRHWR